MLTIYKHLTGFAKSGRSKISFNLSFLWKMENFHFHFQEFSGKGKGIP